MASSVDKTSVSTPSEQEPLAAFGLSAEDLRALIQAAAQVPSLSNEVARLQGMLEVLRMPTAAPEQKAPEPEPLIDVATERRMVIESLASQKRVGLFIAPNEDEKQMADRMKKLARVGQDIYPPRLFRVNGVEIAVPVGKLTEVPQTIAEMYAYAENPWQALNTPPPITFEEATERLG